MAVQIGEPQESQKGNGVLHQGSFHYSSNSEHQIEFEEIDLISKTRQDKNSSPRKILPKIRKWDLYL